MSAYFTSLLFFNITCYLLPIGRMIVTGIFERILDYRDLYQGSILACQCRDWGTPRNSRSGETIWRPRLECDTSFVRSKTADPYIMTFSIGSIPYTEHKYPLSWCWLRLERNKLLTEVFGWTPGHCNLYLNVWVIFADPQYPSAFTYFHFSYVYIFYSLLCFH
jgi:hypothetical protein